MAVLFARKCAEISLSRLHKPIFLALFDAIALVAFPKICATHVESGTQLNFN